jgi:hypothetical protein
MEDYKNKLDGLCKDMEIRKFNHLLGVATIRIYSDGTATFHRKRYSSYKAARRALTKFYGFAYLTSITNR